MLALLAPGVLATSAGCTGLFGPGDEGESIVVESSSGESLDASRHGEGTCGIIFLPQVNSGRESWSPQASELAGDGRIALALDEGDLSPSVIDDVVVYLREEEAVEHVVLVGASIGGEAAVRAAASDDVAVNGIVALSPGGGDDYAADLDGRSLFAVAEGDDERFVRTTQRLHERAPEPTHLELYEGSAHGQGLFDEGFGDHLLDLIDELVTAVCETSASRLTYE